nr:hypothetical protein [Sorangium cellulosum]
MDRPVHGDSRAQQADVAGALADRAFGALGVLLRAFEEAAERDGPGALAGALARGPEHLYGGLLTALLRLAFLLHAEARGLLPVDDPRYAAHLGVHALFRELAAEHAARPAAMRRRSGAWARLVALFRAVFHGLGRPELTLPARRGQLFDPERYPFLERAGTGAPPLDDATVHAVLERLLVLDGRPLSYRALDVEQLGGLYEALMGYRVERAAGPTVCLRPERVWVSAAEALAQPRARRAAWLAERAGLSRREAKRLGEALAAAGTEAEVLGALGPLRARDTEVLAAGRLFLQPGAERRRTSSHYTPRSLSAPIVARTLEPLLRQLGEEPPSARLLGLAICDPAMGSGAFLLEACRYLADQVVAAWAREAAAGDAAAAERLARGREDAVGEARRLVARRCLYGADKNPFAVSLARLSLWLVTRARDEPFTFVDHALRHGDSLVGLDLAQLRGFHWKPAAPAPPLCDAIDAALERALALRRAPGGPGRAGGSGSRGRRTRRSAGRGSSATSWWGRSSRTRRTGNGCGSATAGRGSRSRGCAAGGRPRRSSWPCSGRSGRARRAGRRRCRRSTGRWSSRRCSRRRARAGRAASARRGRRGSTRSWGTRRSSGESGSRRITGTSTPRGSSSCTAPRRTPISPPTSSAARPRCSGAAARWGSSPRTR